VLHVPTKDDLPDVLGSLDTQVVGRPEEPEHPNAEHQWDHDEDRPEPDSSLGRHPHEDEQRAHDPRDDAHDPKNNL
jgi:hypothetical protein